MSVSDIIAVRVATQWPILASSPWSKPLEAFSRGGTNKDSVEEPYHHIPLTLVSDQSPPA